MSNSFAIAAVTASIRNLLFDAVNGSVDGADVTVRPPDRARANGNGNQLNVFLYQTSLDAAWRNQDLPQVRGGENGHPPLPLILYYLVTAYGDGDNEVVGHSLLGHAMSVLHDHPLLGPDEIKAALPESDLDQQIERVRITPQPLTLEEMSKLWTTFQTQYRISAAYQACVVLIESTRPTRAPLPVLVRGAEDRGVEVQALPLFPTIDGVEPPNQQPSALLGASILLTGHHLEGTTAIRVRHPRLDDPLPPPALTEVTGGRVRFTLANDPAAIPAGLSFVSATLSAPNRPDRFSNEVALAVAPAVTHVDVDRDDGTVTVEIKCRPRIVSGQSVHLLLGEKQIPYGAVTVDSLDELVFTSKAIRPGRHLVRLRVDGVDSHVVDRSGPVPAFDETMKVQVP